MKDAQAELLSKKRGGVNKKQFEIGIFASARLLRSIIGNYSGTVHFIWQRYVATLVISSVLSRQSLRILHLCSSTQNNIITVSVVGCHHVDSLTVDTQSYISPRTRENGIRQDGQSKT